MAEPRLSPVRIFRTIGVLALIVILLERLPACTWSFISREMRRSLTRITMSTSSTARWAASTVRDSLLDLARAARTVRGQASRERLGVGWFRFRKGKGLADRHVEAPLSGLRSRLAELRVLPCRHGARKTREQAGVYTAMPANTFNFRAFMRFLFATGEGPAIYSRYHPPDQYDSTARKAGRSAAVRPAGSAFLRNLLSCANDY